MLAIALMFTLSLCLAGVMYYFMDKTLQYEKEKKSG